MNSATSLALAAALSLTAPSTVPTNGPELVLQYEDHVVGAKILGSANVFGALIVSPDEAMTHSFVGLPPLLTNGSVFAFGLPKDGDLAFTFVIPQLPDDEVQVYAQGVIITDGGILSSPAVALTVPSARNTR